MNKYSSQPLSKIPYDKIKIGMEVISFSSNRGKVVERPMIEHRHSGQWIAIDLDNGHRSDNLQMHFNKVKVK